jgi:hypothetical protein
MPKTTPLGKLNERAFRKAIDKTFTLDFCFHDGSHVNATAGCSTKARAKSTGKSKVRR